MGLEIIGHGGMGVVLKGFDRELKRTVAIKVLAPHLARNSLARKRFAREAQAAAAVVHPHVLAIHQVQAGGRLPFLVMPLVAGESLAERLTAQGTLELKEILRIGMQAAAGLAAAHEQGLVHRDVKPANILLEKGVERAVLTDFGLARAADDVTLTRWGIVAGTPQYMSPEQARGEPLDGRSDLFSLGCVLYEMATGVSPFRTDSMLATMRRLVDDSPQAMASLNPELPPWFIAVVERLLQKDPSGRFNSAAEVSDLLENCLAHVQRPAAVPLPEQLRVYQSMTRGKRRRWSMRRLIAGAAFALALLLAGVVIVLELNKGTLTVESNADDVTLRITQGDKVVEKLTVTQGSKNVRIAAGNYVVEIDGEHDGIAVKDGNVTIERGGADIVRIVRHDVADSAERIAKQVAERIEQLKSKYPHLQRFSAKEHLTKGTPPHPPEPHYGISYSHGVRVSYSSDSGSKTKAKYGYYELREQPTEVSYDPETGVAFSVNFFRNTIGEYQIGDLGVYILVNGPAAAPIRGEIVRILQALGAKQSPPRALPPGAYGIIPTPPSPAHPPRVSADGKPNRDPPGPLPPTVADPPPSNSDRPAEAPGFSEIKELVLSMGSNKFMLDLDAGETMDPPATAGRPEQKLMDVHPNQVQPYHYPTGLTGLSLQAREAKSNDWNASAADVRRALTGNIQRLTHLDIGPAKPATYFFRTGAGTEGILQLLSLVEEPKGIRVRYKTISSETTIATPKAIRHFATSDRVETIAYSADGKRIAIANGNATLILQTSGTSRVKDNWKPSVEILEADTGKPVVSLKLTTAEEDAVLAATPRVSHFEVSTLAFSPDGNVLAVGTRIGQVKLFNARNGELIRSLDDERARLADKETPENWKSLSRAIGSVASLAFSPDGSLLAVCGDSFAEFSDVFDGIEHLGLPVTGPGRLKVWEAKTVTLKHDLVGHSQAYAVAFSSDGSMLASAGRWADGPDHGNGVIIWNPQTGTKTRTILVEANGGTHSVAFSPNKKLMAFGSINFDKENDTSATSIGVAYPLSGITEWQQTIPGWSKPAFSSDGKVIAVLSGGQSIRFVDTETGALKDEIKLADSAPGGRWNDFSITRNGHRMAVAGIDAEGRGSVTVLDLGGALVGAP